MKRGRNRLWLRLWMVFGALLFAGRCVEQAKPYAVQIWSGSRPAEPVSAAAEPASEVRRLRIATWNLKWLDEPGRGSVARSEADLGRLAFYAERLAADVVAVQEVASEAALARVFDPARYAFHLIEGSGRQRVGFVVRRELRFEARDDVVELALSTLRPAAQIVLHTDAGPLWLLSLHLKAFCVSGPLDPSDEHCRKLAAQLPILERWIDERARAGQAFAVLGDFNRTFDMADPLWGELDDGDPSSLRLVRTDLGRQSLCDSRQRGRPFIDHLWFGGSAADWVAIDTFRELRYEETSKAMRRRLSDHCPVVVRLDLPL